MPVRDSKFVSRPEDIPQEEHWAIITGSSVHHEAVGVWAPGHGYPEHNEDVITYQAFFNEEEFKVELQRRFSEAFTGSKYIGIHVDKIYRKQTQVVVVEEALSKK